MNNIRIVMIMKATSVDLTRNCDILGSCGQGNKVRT